MPSLLACRPDANADSSIVWEEADEQLVARLFDETVPSGDKPDDPMRAVLDEFGCRPTLERSFAGVVADGTLAVLFADAPCAQPDLWVQFSAAVSPGGPSRASQVRWRQVVATAPSGLTSITHCQRDACTTSGLTEVVTAFAASMADTLLGRQASAAKGVAAAQQIEASPFATLFELLRRDARVRLKPTQVFPALATMVDSYFEFDRAQQVESLACGLLQHLGTRCSLELGSEAQALLEDLYAAVSVASGVIDNHVVHALAQTEHGCSDTDADLFNNCSPSASWVRNDRTGRWRSEATQTVAKWICGTDEATLADCWMPDAVSTVVDLAADDGGSTGGLGGLASQFSVVVKNGPPGSFESRAIAATAQAIEVALIQWSHRDGPIGRYVQARFVHEGQEVLAVGRATLNELRDRLINPVSIDYDQGFGLPSFCVAESQCHFAPIHVDSPMYQAMDEAVGGVFDADDAFLDSWGHYLTWARVLMMASDFNSIWSGPIDGAFDVDADELDPCLDLDNSTRRTPVVALEPQYCAHTPMGVGPRRQVPVVLCPGREGNDAFGIWPAEVVCESSSGAPVIPPRVTIVAWNLGQTTAVPHFERYDVGKTGERIAFPEFAMARLVRRFLPLWADAEEWDRIATEGPRDWFPFSGFGPTGTFRLFFAKHSDAWTDRYGNLPSVPVDGWAELRLRYSTTASGR